MLRHLQSPQSAHSPLICLDFSEPAGQYLILTETDSEDKNLVRLSLFLALAIAVPSISAAFEVSQNGRMTAEPFKSQNDQCLANIKRKIAPKFDGLNGVALSTPNYNSDSKGVFTLLTYAGVTFSSAHGNVKGVINCVFLDNGTRLSNVVATFEQPGLAGAPKFYTGKKEDASERRSQGYGVEIFD